MIKKIKFKAQIIDDVVLSHKSGRTREKINAIQSQLRAHRANARRLYAFAEGRKQLPTKHNHAVTKNTI